ncbi:hypothetical protein COB52_02435 [Candidatus Kaiserbacteria bacterium]|nr:MAG: hypothetical protein COB52_02435 [Candidatus Kaiserbacteria bacterium]
MPKYLNAAIVLKNYFRSVSTDWNQTSPQMMMGGKLLEALYLGEHNYGTVGEFQSALKRTFGINTHWAKVAIKAAELQHQLFKTQKRAAIAKYSGMATLATRFGDHFEVSDPDAAMQFRTLLQITAESDLQAHGIRDVITTNCRVGEILGVCDEPWFKSDMNTLSDRWKYKLPKTGRPNF